MTNIANRMHIVFVLFVFECVCFRDILHVSRTTPSYWVGVLVPGFVCWHHFVVDESRVNL